MTAAHLLRSTIYPTAEPLVAIHKSIAAIHPQQQQGGGIGDWLKGIREAIAKATHTPDLTDSGPLSLRSSSEEVAPEIIGFGLPSFGQQVPNGDRLTIA